MRIYKILALFIFTLSNSAYAEEKGKIGFSLNIVVSGFFSPELAEVTVKEVFADSPAEAAGVLAGQKILSIDGCDIPGCPASKAKKLMKRKSGDILPILVEESDGNQILINIRVK